jgi:hypothetical protein
MIFTMGKGDQTSWFADNNECLWVGLGCDCFGCAGNVLVTFDARRNNGLAGTIPVDVGLFTSVTTFSLFSKRQISGLLPSTIDNFSVAKNSMTGTIPKEVVNWRAIKSAYFYGNLFKGTMPTIGSNFCPANETATPRTTSSWAVCKPGAVGIGCACCDTCCDDSGNCCDVTGRCFNVGT